MRSFHFPGRSPVMGRHAMCATSHPAASLAAVEVLKSGGNAMDAAITACAVLCVVEPAMTGIGGDCFAIVAKPGHAPIGLNGCGRAASGATPEWFRGAGLSAIEMTSPHAVLVPGAIAGWALALEQHGSIGLDRALRPAIGLARDGFVVTPRVGFDWARARAKLSRHEGARTHYMPGDRIPSAGEVMQLPALAASLEQIATNGRDGFYTGKVAEDLVATLRDLGGLHTPADFAAQRASAVTPVSVRYRDVELFELPPSNQGLVALLLLRMHERMGPVAGGPDSPERYHVLLEAARLAYAVRDRYVADPEVAQTPVEAILSDRYVDNLVARIDRKQRRTDLGPVPAPVGSDTTYLTVVDETGMAVSFINSLFSDFGSGIVGRRSGIALNNRAQGFSLDPRHPNAIAPGKRPLHTLVPAYATRGGRPWLSFGVMGGAFQPTGHVFVLTSMVEHGLDPQEAIDLPRIFFEGGETLVEETVPAHVLSALEGMGHQLRTREAPWGGGQMVMMDHASGVLVGASDARKDGCALGW